MSLHRAGRYREFVLVVCVGLLLFAWGVWIDHPALALLCGLVSYLLWHMHNLHRLSLWLDEPKHHEPPSALGGWGEIVHAVEALRERGRKRKRKLSRMLSGFHQSTNALPDATVVLNDRGQVEWWNSAASKIFGFRKKRSSDRSLEELIPDPMFRKYLAQGDYSQPLQMPGPLDHKRTLEVRIVPYGKGKRLLQARDVTRLQQLEIVRRDFVANLSHEMRTPLTVIHGYLETLNDAEDPEFSPWCHIINQMYQQTTRMQRIVEDLLLLARLEREDAPQRDEPVDVALLLTTIQSEAEALSGDQHHHIELEIVDDYRLLGVERELDSAFSNLVFNAVRYTPAGGLIRMRWERTEQGACFSVTDSGIGIDPEHIPRLTERFYRVDVARSRRSGGTGLGLAIVKHVLTRHCGELQVESEPGKGSRFSCLFPTSRVLAEGHGEASVYPTTRSRQSS